MDNVKIEINAVAFSQFVKIAKKTVLKKSCINMLKSACFEIDPFGLKITAGGLESTTIFRDASQVCSEKTGFLVNFAYIENIAKLIVKDSKKVSIDKKGDLVYFSVDDCDVGNIGIFDASDYPHELEKETADETATGVDSFDVDEIKAMAEVNKYVSTDRTRSSLCGVAFGLDDDGHRSICACDGHRAALRGPSLNDSEKTFKDIFIVRSDVIDAISTVKESLTLTVHPKESEETRVKFSIGNGIEICSRTFGGPYPNIKMVIPNNFYAAATIDVKKMVSALKILSNSWNPRTHKVRLNFYNNIELTAWNTDNSTSSKAIVEYNVCSDKRLREGNNIENYHIGFDGKYLLGIFNGMKSKNVKACFCQKNIGATIWEPAEMDQNDTRYLLMPVYMQDDED